MGAQNRRLRAKKLRMWKQDRRCRYCLRALTLEEATVDHLVPQSLGGTGVDSNIVLACAECNGRKGASLVSELLEGETVPAGMPVRE